MSLNLYLIGGNAVTCYDCPNVGATAPDDGTGKPIAWCHAKRCIVAPERGCDRHPLFYARRKEPAPCAPPTASNTP